MWEGGSRSDIYRYMHTHTGARDCLGNRKNIYPPSLLIVLDTTTDRTPCSHQQWYVGIHFSHTSIAVYS